jgi:hypothetical protein
VTSPTWRIELADLRTDRKLTDVAPLSMSFDRLIGKPGSCSATVALPDATTAEEIRACDPQRTALYVYYGSDIWWGGILWQRRIQRDGRGMHTIELAAAGFESYLYRVISDETGWVTGPYTNLDQLEIARRLITEMQSPDEWFEFADIGLTVDSHNSGVLRTVRWDWGAVVSYGKALDQVAGYADGFEYTIDAYHDAAGVRHRHMRLGYPQITRPDAEHVVEDHAIASWTWDEDGTRTGTRGLAQGAQINYGLVMGPITSDMFWDWARLEAGWPVLSWVRQNQGLYDWDEVQRIGEAAAALEHGGPVVLPSVTVRLSETDITPQMLGDRVRLRIHDLWHSPPLDQTWRLIGIKVQPPTRQQKDGTLDLTLEVPRA